MKRALATITTLALLSATVPCAQAGDKEWATAGKVMAGIGAGLLLAKAFEPPPVYMSPAPVVVHQPAPVVVQQPAQIVVVQQPARQQVIVQPQPLVVQQPVIYQPAPVIYHAPVVVYRPLPPPVYYHPPPVYCPPRPVVGFHFSIGAHRPLWH